MSQRRSFYRKVGYVVAIAILLIPLSILSMPGTGREAGENAGGVLAQMQHEHRLGTGSLGEIDPASETMKLATLGLRGVATVWLWDKATNYKRVEDWTNFAATLDQLRKLQPHFISVWRYQGWNLSYNMSAEFDDYRDRYSWVIRGINFLKEGERYNGGDPRLRWDLGWFIAQKIGRSDERRQYRRLFREDDDFHAGTGRTPRERDNWLVGKEWFQKAIDADRYGPRKMKGQGPLLFKSHPAKAQIDYAEALQEDGNHGEIARLAWKKGHQEWLAFGDESILTSYGYRIRLNDQEEQRRQAERYARQLDKLAGDVRDELYLEKFNRLSEEEQKLVNQDLKSLGYEDHDRWYQLTEELKVTHRDVVDYIQDRNPEIALEAARLAELASQAETYARTISHYRDTVNFNYWRDRSEFEQVPETLEARELVYQAQQAHRAQRLEQARQLYEQAWDLWSSVLEEHRYETIVNDGTLGEDLVDQIHLYRRLLSDLDEEFPEDFPLAEVVRRNDLSGLMTDLFPPRSAELDQTDEEQASKEEEGEPEKTTAAAKSAADNDKLPQIRPGEPPAPPIEK